MVEQLLKYRCSLALVVLMFFMIACGSQQSRDKKLNISKDELVADSAINAGMQSLKQIFYSMPSPLETALLLKRAGAKYNEEVLNSVDNISRYTTIKSMALNMGIYSTDLSYASLFDQTQTTILYMSASKKIAEGLGILNAIDERTIQRLEENVNNRDVIMEIISETFLNTNSILEEEDRVAIGSIILVGGWIEGIYIAASLVEDPSKTDSELIDRIIDQKFSLESVQNLLKQNINNNDVKDVLKDIMELKQIFDEVQIAVSDVEVVPDKATNVTTLRSKNVASVSPEVFGRLKAKVSSIRAKYVE